jgi:DNA primase
MSRGWVSYEAVKAAVSMRAVIEDWGVAGLRSTGRHQYRGRCPIHGGQGEDAFHVNLERNIFHCFACQAGGNVLDLVAALDQCSVREAALRLQQRWLHEPSPEVHTVRRSPGQLVTEKRECNRRLPFTLAGLDSTHPYLVGRGVTQATAASFGIGYYAGPGLLNRRLVIPIHDEAGTLVAYCGRALEPVGPRYRFPAGFVKSAVLFNFHRARAAGGDELIVVEGFFDCLRVHQAGLPAVAALMGVALSATQQDLLLRRFGRIALMLDGDATGRAASSRIAARLRPYCAVREVLLPPDCQPDELSETEIRRKLSLHE